MPRTIPVKLIVNGEEFEVEMTYPERRRLLKAVGCFDRFIGEYSGERTVLITLTGQRDPREA